MNIALERTKKCHVCGEQDYVRHLLGKNRCSRCLFTLYKKTKYLTQDQLTDLIESEVNEGKRIEKIGIKKYLQLKRGENDFR